MLNLQILVLRKNFTMIAPLPFVGLLNTSLLKLLWAPKKDTEKVQTGGLLEF